MMKFLKKLVRNENGATAIEYGLIAALLAVGIIAAVSTLRNALNSTFNSTTIELDNARAENPPAVSNNGAN
jgi:pilus assembly protein Flp/PilA